MKLGAGFSTTLFLGVSLFSHPQDMAHLAFRAVVDTAGCVAIYFNKVKTGNRSVKSFIGYYRLQLRTRRPPKCFWGLSVEGAPLTLEAW